MDPRQPQLPFSRNSSSPYGRTPFTPSTNPPPSYPPSSHAPPASTSYSDHQRRPSDPPYYNSPRGYGADAVPAHSRHQSASAVVQGSSVNRTMPPPSSPPLQTQHGYGPPPPRAPPVSVGAPSAFPSGRELPSITSLSRPSSNSNGMSISSILGGPTPAAREQPTSQYSPGPAPAPPSSIYTGSTHVSPRATTAASDYSPFRRPQTPEHTRPYEPRDHQPSSAVSPTGVAHYGASDRRRYGTTPTYAQRPPPAEERREPTRPPHQTAIPPRPSSQPNGFNASARPADSRASIHTDSVFSRRDNGPRADPIRDPAYQRNEYEERHNSAYSYAERARQERDAAIQREREQRDRTQTENGNTLQQQDYAHQVGHRNAQGYSRGPEPREQQAWMRSAYETPRAPPYEPIPEQQPQQPQHREPIPAHEYPRSAAPQYGGQVAYTSSEPRHPTSHPQTMTPQQTSNPAPQYETSMQERQRAAEQQVRLLQQQLAMYGGPHQGASYQSQESPTRRPFEDSHHMQQQTQQRSLLGVQEMNRKGRVSPLPQAVQGVQGQIGGPGEPGIKSEFGRMFSGIGSGVGAMGVSSPVATQQGLPNSGQLRREDLDGLQGHDSPSDKGGYGNARSSSRGGSRRRKLKDDDARGDDESSTGRNTPSGRGKRLKAHAHAHHHHHHHHHHDAQEIASSPSHPSAIPFKSIRGSADPSPQDPKAISTLHHHHVPRHHHHHVTPVPKPAITPLPKVTIRSKAVLDSVSHMRRAHLGYDFYQNNLSPNPHSSTRRSPQRGFASSPRPLPRFEGQENSTFTIKVPRIFLTPEIRAEITSRKAVWGTDIYTDDSDIIAACIHQGWFRGEWDEDVDTSLLGLELKEGPPDSPKMSSSEPPSKGPMHVPADRDCHITILVLPLLEKYSSTTRFGLRSREWGGDHDGYQGVHDGLSFMIMNVRWVDGEMNEGGRVMKRKLLLESEKEAEKEDEAFFSRIAANEPLNGNADIQESFERGEPSGFPRDIKAVGTRSWFKASAATRKKKIAPIAPIVEKKKEPQNAEEVQGAKPMEGVVMETEEKASEKAMESAEKKTGETTEEEKEERVEDKTEEKEERVEDKTEEKAGGKTEEKDPEKADGVQGDKLIEDVVMETEEKALENAEEDDEQKEKPKKKTVIERVTERMIENANAHANLTVDS